MTESALDSKELGRAALIERLCERLHTLDDASLVELELRTRPPAGPAGTPAGEEEWEEGAPETVSRRHFLRTTLGVGAVGVVAAAGVGYAAWEVGGLRERTRAELALGAEILKLQGLLALYDQLERIGLDSIAATGLLAMDRGLDLIEAGADALRGGMERVEAAMLDLDEPFLAIQQGIARVEEVVAATAAALQRLEDSIEQAINPARPVAEAALAFADRLLGLLPFGVGDSIRRGIEDMVAVVTSVPEMVLAVNEHLLQPLRQRWFDTDPATGILSGFIEDVVSGLLDPAEAHLQALAALSETWQQRLALPLQAALDERSALRDDILRFRGEAGL